MKRERESERERERECVRVRVRMRLCKREIGRQSKGGAFKLFVRKAHECSLETTQERLQHTAAHCTALQRTATHCSALHRTTTHCNTLQHTTARCKTLQHAECENARNTDARACAQTHRKDEHDLFIRVT